MHREAMRSLSGCATIIDGGGTQRSRLGPNVNRWSIGNILFGGMLI
jgi:hypothetical protein